MAIQVLSDEVASAIAAGEVIERPASVVKELMENSIDASAREITVTITDAGRTEIRVDDDGSGIGKDELETAVQRHATSKLQSREDLFAISTLGFRGEALSSIAAVSRMELISRPSAQASARQLIVEGGRVLEESTSGAPVGTTVVVRDLFYNVPARREFLKTERTELVWIRSFVQRYALAHPDIRFRLVVDGRQDFASPGSGDRRETLAEMFGVDRARMFVRMQPLAAGETVIEGYLSPPQVHRSNRRELTFFVNGRWVQDRALSAAAMQAYHGLLMVGRYPIVVLFIQVPAEQVDVNVHPAKAEVRFRDPGQLFRIVQRAVRATLLEQAPPPAARAEPGSKAGGADWGAGFEGQPQWAALGPEPEVRSLELLPADISGEIPLLRAVGQIGASYLVAEGPEGLYLVDQHAAHERILFERLMDQVRNGKLESQGLLEPVTVELTVGEDALLGPQLPALRELGFEVEAFGSRTYRVRSLPSLLIDLNPQAALRTVVEDFEEDETPLERVLEEKIAARVCKRAAIKGGQVLSVEEQRQLLRQLESCRVPRTCPHGRPTMIHMSVDSLERQFGRRG